MVPAPQVRVTLTVVVSVPGLSEKSLLTVKVALFRVLVMVQGALPFGLRVTAIVQPPQVRVMLTAVVSVPGLSEKSLLTVKVALFSVLLKVQVTDSPALRTI